MIGANLQLENCDKLGGPLVGGRTRHSIQAALKNQLEPPDHLIVGATRLADVADQLADLVWLTGEVAPRHPGRASAWRQKGGEHAQGGRLAGAVRTQESEDLARPHGQIHSSDRLDHLLARLEDAPESMSLDRSTQVPRSHGGYFPGPIRRYPGHQHGKRLSRLARGV